jgi:hypothetical protein
MLGTLHGTKPGNQKRKQGTGEENHGLKSQRWTGPRGFYAVFQEVAIIAKTAKTQINRYQNQEEEEEERNS